MTPLEIAKIFLSAPSNELLASAGHTTTGRTITLAQEVIRLDQELWEKNELIKEAADCISRWDDIVSVINKKHPWLGLSRQWLDKYEFNKK